MASRKNGNSAPTPPSDKLEKLGALWLGKSARGVSYMSGVVTIDGTEHRVVVFKNGFKDTAKHPDYVIYASNPREEAPTAAATDGDAPPF